MEPKRKRRNLGSRRRWAKRCLESGLPQREFAMAHGLAVSSLDRWVREFCRSRDDPAEQAAAGFVEVTAAEPAPPAMVVRVIVGSVTLEFEQLPPAEYVVALGRISC